MCDYIILFGFLLIISSVNTAQKCSINPECRPTCAIPNPQNCTYTEPSASNIDGCQCQDGYILSETDGKCIKIEDCPANQGCNGDSHAVVKQCPLPCPSTCESPNALPCKRKCDPIGCECAPGYLLSKNGGKCIRPDECEGGNPCGLNETFVQCKSGCPNDYCPVDDSLAVVICEYYPFSPCYSGCNCQINHKRKSSEDQRCIVSSDCPPVDCTRPHEVWDSCPLECSSGYCDAVDMSDYTCNTLLLNCQPRCVCEKNYFRNASGICVSAEECRRINAQDNVSTPTPEPQCGYNEVISECKIVCPPQTCDSIYSLYACDNETSCELGCDCLDGYLRNNSGICVPSEECPTPSPPTPESQCGYNEVISECRIVCPPQTCDSIYSLYACDNETSCQLGCDCLDGYLRNNSGICVPSEECPTPSPPTPESQCGYNEVISECRIVCPPQTCDSIYSLYVCDNETSCQLGCDCLDGYLRNTSGICVPSEECPTHGNSCGVNETLSDCGFRCPNQYCPQDDSLVQYACKPGRPCPPGCLCKDNYKRISYENDSCVLASDCPSVSCTRPNEVWNSCPKCPSDYCKDSCDPDPSENDCQPRCVCAKSYCRDENDACIAVTEC